MVSNITTQTETDSNVTFSSPLLYAPNSIDSD